MCDLYQDAVCLDGSAPGYYLRRGSGAGASRWKLHLMGGGWCSTDGESCHQRSLTKYGSTKSWPDSLAFGGFLSDDVKMNPDFYDWNMVFVIYCDGASFAGNRFH